MLDKIKSLFVHDNTRVFAVMAIGAALGLIASFTLSVEAIQIAKNANTVLSCDINAAISCGAVGRTPQASLLGFPNAFIGVVSFSVMLTVAAAGLMGTRFPKLFMYLAWLGAMAGFIFAAWMFLTSVFVIGVLCPWCLTTDVATLAVLWALTRYNMREHNLYVFKRMQKAATNCVQKNYDTLSFVAIAVLAVLIVIVALGKQL